jgi:hypothetical protein
VATIAGVSSLQINSQEELHLLHPLYRLVAEGSPLPLKAAPGQRPKRYPRQG